MQMIIDDNMLLQLLEKGDKTSYDKILWQPAGRTICYLPVTYDVMLARLKRPENASGNLTIHLKKISGNFELLIFNVPWGTRDVPFTPLVRERMEGKIVGVMLPFNELAGVLKDTNAIDELSIYWINFTFERRTVN